MKVIFLDIDGVLNSKVYDRQRGEADGNIDKTRLPLLKRLADETGADIVLSSSWRRRWEKDPAACDPAGRELCATFAEAGLAILDKTPCLEKRSRADEVRAWLSAHPGVQSFVIFDDDIFGWGDLSDRLIATNAYIGRGLEERHVERALELLG
ncbi:MAG: hypothetical protein IJU41_07410 [Clostridia bacterium]|nr:hypothetical protein [Clostridia bacterium]